MKFLGAISKYQKLSPEQRSFIGNAQRKFCSTPAELLEFFKPMAVYDKSCDEARAQLLNFVILCGVLSFLGLIAIGVLSEDMPMVIPIVGIIFLMIFPALILRWRLGRVDIHNNLREFVVPMVNLIGQDTAAEQKINLELDLSGKKLEGKLRTRTKDDPGWLAYPKTTTSIYDDPWFRMTTDLVDGSKLMLTIDDQITTIDRTYKSISGKIKSKSKAKVKHMIRASLALKHKKYAIASQNDLQSFGHELKLKDGANRQVFCLKQTVKTDDIDAFVDPQLCVALLGRIFMNVQPAGQKGS
ncbi:MAG: hypothetical protein A2W80_06185 [Candidatus Riflebacteria bacterium GWC2_50_8]|nr:MAG: hypothetical protein A2W80_06185 [Candidatus Riflebacteria bacterium GWC2_50_8]